jgi:RNA-binding protein 26
MHVDNPEALRTWLTAFLEPLCDADPAALSKYVLALVKKDKTQEDLKKSMVEQMQVFLQRATQPFVEHLFKALETKEYLKGPPENPLVPGTTPLVKEDKVEETPSAGDKQPADSTTPVRGGGATSATASGEAEGAVRAHHGEDEGERGRGDRYRRGEGYERPRRRSSRSPPPRRYGHGRRSPPLTMGAAGGGRGGGRYPSSRSRSPYRHRRSSRSPPPPAPYRRSRSRSYSPSSGFKRRADSHGSSPTKDEEAGGSNPYLPKRPRCRDYDEKGFCMRGDQCKFDHGSDAVVLEDSSAALPGAVPPPLGVTPYQPQYAGNHHSSLSSILFPRWRSFSVHASINPLYFQSRTCRRARCLYLP